MVSKPPKEETILSVITEMAANIGEVTGLTEAQSTQMADTIIRNIQDKFGGSSVYIHAADRNNQHKAIRNDWVAGLTVKAIMRKHDVSRRTIYRVIAGA